MPASMNFFDAISFTTPELFLAVIPVLFAVLTQIFVRRSAVDFTGLEYIRSRQYLDGRPQHVVRAILRCTVIIGLGILWAGPTCYTTDPLFNGDSGAGYKTFVVAFDMSPSMNLPANSIGNDGEDLAVGAEGVTRYEMARRALVDFLDRFRGERFGLILFSTEPLFARWPTVETENNFSEVLEDIRRGAGTQLESFSSLTNADKALAMARGAFDGVDGAIILVSDAEDDLENLGAEARRIREAGIRLYTIGVGVSTEVVKQLSEEFMDDPGFRIFRVDSKEQMQEAYRLVGEVEESPLLAGEAGLVESDLRGILAIILLLAACALFWIEETALHGVARPVERKVTYGI